MMKASLIGLLPVVLSGCLDIDLDPLPESMVLSTHIRRGGHGTIRMDWQNITSSKKGADGEKRVAEFIQEFKKTEWSKPGEFADGCTNVTHGIGRDSDGKLNGYVQGDFPDIFVMFRRLDSSSPYKLRKDATFKFQWDGESLSITREWTSASAVESRSSFNERDVRIKLVISTDGEFVSSTCGQLSEKRKKLVVENVESILDQEWSFSIKGLAEN